ncbi:MAG: UDP-N-acetylmuramate dehydrogenase [Rickettsiaceae bacterium]|nr:UDP-N-acetylmuramate dehydrogenase [Rickettsiaceae bacterium]
MNLHNIRGSLKENYNLANLTWFKVGGSADLFFKPSDIDDLIVFLKQYSGPITVIGAGSNVIIRDSGVEGVVIKLTQGFNDIVIEDNKLIVGAGCLNYNLSKYCAVNSITGLEFLVGIPGCIGGGVVMNAGSYGSEFKDIIEKIHIVDFAGETKIINAEDIIFKYRETNLPNNIIITKVEFKITKGNTAEINATMDEISQRRSSTQPITEKTGGSTFANPEGLKAWQLIDKVGLRGFKLGGARISEQHCNFLINEANATASDIETLGEFVRNRVFEQEGIKLKWEIKRIGRIS